MKVFLKAQVFFCYPPLDMADSPLTISLLSSTAFFQLRFNKIVEAYERSIVWESGINKTAESSSLILSNESESVDVIILIFSSQ